MPVTRQLLESDPEFQALPPEVQQQVLARLVGPQQTPTDQPAPTMVEGSTETPSAPSSEPGLLDTAGEVLTDPAATQEALRGVGQGMTSTAMGMGETIRFLRDKLTGSDPTGGASLAARIAGVQEAAGAVPENRYAEFGKGAEQIAEFIPGGAGRIPLQMLRAGVTSTVQGSTPGEAALSAGLAGAIPALGRGLTSARQGISRAISRSMLGGSASVPAVEVLVEHAPMSLTRGGAASKLASKLGTAEQEIADTVANLPNKATIKNPGFDIIQQAQKKVGGGFTRRNAGAARQLGQMAEDFAPTPSKLTPKWAERLIKDTSGAVRGQGPEAAAARDEIRTALEGELAKLSPDLSEKQTIRRVFPEVVKLLQEKGGTGWQDYLKHRLGWLIAGAGFGAATGRDVTSGLEGAGAMLALQSTPARLAAIRALRSKGGPQVSHIAGRLAAGSVGRGGSEDEDEERRRAQRR